MPASSMMEAGEEGPTRPISLRSARWLAMALLLLFYVGGIHHAWRALSIPRHALPTNQTRQLQTALALAADAAAPHPQLCRSALRMHCTVLPAEQPQADWQALDVEALAATHLQPALRQLTTEVHVGSSLLLHPPRLPPEQLRWDAQRKAHLLLGVAGFWGQQVQQLAWSAGPAHSDPSLGPAAVQVLLYLPPSAQQPLMLELAGGSAANSMELADGSLLLIVNPDVEGGGTGSGGIEARLAQDILSWLLQPLNPSSNSSSSSSSGDSTSSNTSSTSTSSTSSSSVNSEGAPTQVLRQLRRSLAAGCAAAAASALQRFVAAAEAAPKQPITPGMADYAAATVQLLDAASRGLQPGKEEEESRRLYQGWGLPLDVASESLTTARAAWYTAHKLLLHPGTGALQAFPPEHALAVLMALALPLTVVLARAALAELGMWLEPWRARRRARWQALWRALVRQARVQRRRLHLA